MTYKCPSCERTFDESEGQIDTDRPGDPTCPYDGTALKQQRAKADDKDEKGE
jgi:hypothetical protein